MNGYNKYERMEDPPERTPGRIEKVSRDSNDVKGSRTTLSLNAVRRINKGLVLFIWTMFFLIVIVGGYKLLGAYTGA